MSRRDVVVVVAFGTRGDVQPLAVLARSLYLRNGFAVTFITHAAHESALKPLLYPAAFCGLPSLPAACWRGESQSAGGHSWRDDPEAREACVRAVCECFLTCRIGGGAALLHNLFALEAVHLAEALGVPSCAAAPYVVPYGMPSGFAGALERTLPAVAHALRHTPPGTLSMREVEHWLWPLWTERWGDWRADRLRLPALPLDVGDDAPVTLPRAPPLLYGFSEQLVTRPGYWPESTHITGFWHAERDSAYEDERDLEPEPGYAPPSTLNHFLTAFRPVSDPVALITFGSMASMDGALPFPRTLLRCLAEALTEARLRGVLLMDAGSSLAAAWRAGADTLHDDGTSSVAAWPHMLGVATFVPHKWLMPRCHVVLHHGGSGTCAAALRAGVSQAIMPFMYDQFFWAERLAEIGVAAALNHLVVLCDPRDAEEVRVATYAIEQALRAALAPAVKQAAREWRSRLVYEDGIPAAVDIIAREAALCKTGDVAAAARRLLAPLPPEAAADDEEPPDASHVHLPGGLRVAAVGTAAEVAHLYEEIFVSDVYLRRGFGAALRPGTLVIDVGANIGLFCLRIAALFASRNERAARVLALEPLPRTFAALQENVATLPGVTPLQLGVVAECEPSRAEFTFWPRMSGQSTLYPAEKLSLQRHAIAPCLWARPQTVSCPVTTLHALFAAHLAPGEHVSLLKIDVEGAELDVLRSLQPCDWGRVDAVVAEVHDVDGRADAAVAMLVAAGLDDVAVDVGVVAAHARVVYARRRLEEARTFV